MFSKKSTRNHLEVKVSYEGDGLFIIIVRRGDDVWNALLRQNVLHPDEVIFIAQALRVHFCRDELIWPDGWDASCGPECSFGGICDSEGLCNGRCKQLFSESIMCRVLTLYVKCCFTLSFRSLKQIKVSGRFRSAISRIVYLLEVLRVDTSVNKLDCIVTRSGLWGELIQEKGEIDEIEIYDKEPRQIVML